MFYLSWSESSVCVRHRPHEGQKFQFVGGIAVLTLAESTTGISVGMELKWSAEDVRESQDLYFIKQKNKKVPDWM